jgi:hypothetical protein
MKKLLASLFLALPLMAHSVTMTWADSLNPAGTTYNVYRAAGACPAAPPTVTPPTTEGFALLVAGLTTKTETDSTVAGGAIYCYLVTAVVSGAESAPSNIAQAGSFPPTMLTITVVN